MRWTISFGILIIWGVLYSQPYQIKKSAFDISGQLCTGGSYKLMSAVGQSVTGYSSGGSYTETAGILHSNLFQALGVEYEFPGNNQIPGMFRLLPNSPNPCSDHTDINFEVPRSSAVSIFMFDVSGREVFEIVNGNFQPGFYRIQVNTAYMSSGTYFVLMKSENFISSAKLIISR
ncbi:MAG: T9SS type A sorting domain-containing protein [bacterium]